MDPLDAPTPSWEIGRHLVRWERPDLVFLTLRGPTSAAEAMRIRAIYAEIGERVGPYHVVFDASELVFIEAGSRAAWTRADKPYPFRSVLVFGANFSTRAVIMTVYRAGRLVAPSLFEFHFEFVSTEVEARARIDEFRSRAG
ncbi:hypothetical protein [Polyangium spumosum]|uniref:STAS/SEC14 domain-containing protein n=1 Tax=Polyangium spumosum TaxID=889282 RepID=A0A6N7PPW2_9BACT|nr:hypothetical protein [Polyangium spumosum]MRG92124.1 hypothetical protein [Polyangium spumosum]